MALTPKNGAQPRSEAVGSEEVGGEEMEGLASEEMEGVMGDEWLEEGANERMDEGSVSPTPPRFGSPTPSQNRAPVPRPVTPTRGRKRMACGTPAPVRVGAPRGGGEWAVGARLQASIAAMEARLNGKLAALTIAGEAREIRLSEKLALVWEAVKAEQNTVRDVEKNLKQQVETLGQKIVQR
jgi:hypothetical protein